jgi:hypothetical protein
MTLEFWIVWVQKNRLTWLYLSFKSYCTVHMSRVDREYRLFNTFGMAFAHDLKTPLHGVFSFV